MVLLIDHKKIGLLSNTGLDPLKNRKATRPDFNVSPSSGRKTPFKWPFAGRPMMAHFLWYFDHLSSHQLKKDKNLDPSDKSFWIRA